MGEREAHNLPGPDDEAEERIARARATIGKSFEELIARTEHHAAELGTVPLPAIEEPREEPRARGWDAPVGTSPGLSTAPTGGEVERRIAEATAGIEARIGEWVNGRVQAAERRLELQSQALEASIGEGAVGAQRAIEQIEQAKLELTEAKDRARAEVTAAVEEGRGRMRSAADEQAAGSLGAAEARIAELEALMSERLEERVTAAVAEAGVATTLQGEVREGLRAAKAELEASFAAAIAERQADSIERVEAILLREAAKGDARATDATRRIDASLAAAEGRAAEMISELEERVSATVAASEDRSAATINELDERAAQLRAGLEEALRASQGELERSREDEAAAARASLEETIAGALREAEARLERMRIEMVGASDRVAASADAAEVRIDQRLASMSTELQEDLLRQVDATLGDRVAELEPRLEERLSAHVDREAEAAGERADATLTATAAREREQLDVLVATESERARIAIERERNTNVGRATAELASALASSRADLEQVAATLRQEIETTVSQQASETTRAELETRSGEIEERLSGLVQKVAADAEQRLLEAATIVEDRLTAVDRAQEREEIVRRRTASAESAAERRVQEAEQRLMEVLARLEPAESVKPPAD